MAGRLSTLTIGLLAIAVAYGAHDILNVLLATFEAWGPTLFPPLIIILFYPQLPKHFFYFPVLAGIAGLLAWKLLAPVGAFQVGGLIVGITANFMCFLIFFTHKKVAKKILKY